MSIINKFKQVRAKRAPRVLTVKSAVNLTPNMRRVTLQGDDLKTFPANSEGAYFKLVFDQPDSDKSAMRTYTVAQHRSAENEIDVDFMLHASHKGLAAPWSLTTQPGDNISIFGPGPAKLINHDADWFLLAADMTALPALTANLKLLPADACGKAFIEIISVDDKQDLPKPEQVELVWVVNSEPGSDTSPLFHAVEQAEWLQGKIATWVACEFNTMKKIRYYLKANRGLEKDQLYTSSYWKKGITEEEHKVVKQADLES